MSAEKSPAQAGDEVPSSGSRGKRSLGAAENGVPRTELLRTDRAAVYVRNGNLVEVRWEGIVCPANTFLVMRGGVSAVIRRAGGEEVERDAVAQGPIRIGDAVITSGHRIRPRVIHAPTVEMPVDPATPASVPAAVRAALRTADLHSLKSLAFPSMGTGTGGISYELAAREMLGAVARHLARGTSLLETIEFVAFEPKFEEELRRCSALVAGAPDLKRGLVPRTGLHEVAPWINETKAS